MKILLKSHFPNFRKGIVFFATILFFITNALSEPVFSHRHGFCDNAFELKITTSTPGAQIKYTTDGSLPSTSNGITYSTGIPVSSTTIIRAVEIITGQISGKAITQSYFFLNDIIRRGNAPQGYPAMWGPYTAIPGNAIADYEMDQELLGDPVYAASVKKALRDIPAISIVTDISNLFSSSTDPTTGGIYMYTGAPLTTTTYGTGRGWERPVSFEFFDSENSFQVDCGLRIQGGHSRRPEKNSKHSFLVVFHSTYGLSKLNYPLLGNTGSTIFENLILRAGFGNSWTHQENAQRIKATYQEDIWTKDTQRAMGHPSSNSRFVHLYLNGIYWGVYAASERMDKEFAESYIGGNEDDYDVIKDYAEVSDGYIDAWNEMMTLVNAGVESQEKYLYIQGKNADGTPDPDHESLVDVVNLADYMLVNFYGANSDWDHHNWAAMRSRLNPGNGFKFMCWDAEMMFGSVTGSVLTENNNNSPSRIYQQMIKNADFKRLFADRIQRHCFHDGVLTPDSAAARWQKRKNEIESSILAEAARWGDYRRDVHRYQEVGPFNLLTRDEHWMSQQNFIQNTYFPQRTARFITQLRAAGLFPQMDAPVLSINNQNTLRGMISIGDKLSMTATQGSIYYTTNGTDPVDWRTNNINAENAVRYSQLITMNKSAHIVARAYYNGQWSAANSRFYVIPENFKDIKITEIHYNPLGEGLIEGKEFEFIELKNTGTSTLDLGGLKFITGINYEFPPETQLESGGFTVLATNSNQFFARYKFRPAGTYSGKLENSGERLTLIAPDNSIVADFSYGTTENWPLLPNGTGYSLVPTEINPSDNQSTASNWRNSHRIGGSPGADDLPVTGNQKLLANNPNLLQMLQSFPNPFSDRTFIDYQLSENASVEISVYNLTGQKIITLIDNINQPAGLHQVVWNGRDSNSNPVSDGIYFCRISINNATNQISKILLKR